MVSATWVASQLNPYARWIKLGAIALAAVALVATGWVTNGWRLGQKVAALETKVERKEVARQTALNERQAKAIADALAAVTRSQTALEAARQENARLVSKAAQKAPTAPQYACRDIPLPDDYLEEFRR